MIAAGFTGKLRRADAAQPLAATRAEGTLVEAAAARDVGRALAIAAELDAGARRAAYRELAPFAALDAAVRPIFYAHTVKTTEALRRLDEADAEADGLYLEALLVYLVPVRPENRARRTAAVARKFLAGRAAAGGALLTLAGRGAPGKLWNDVGKMVPSASLSRTSASWNDVGKPAAGRRRAWLIGVERQDDQGRVLRRLWPLLGLVTVLEQRSPVDSACARGNRLRLVGYGVSATRSTSTRCRSAVDSTLVLVVASVTPTLRDRLERWS